MQVNKNYEAELNLKDLLFHVLYRWWFILLVGIIVAGVFGFQEYWSFEKYHRNGESTPSETQYESDVAANQQALANAEKELSNFISSTGNYEHITSILMEIDPTNVWTAEKKYYVHVKATADEAVAGTISADQTKKILAFLSEAFPDTADEKELQEIFGTDDLMEINEVAFICIDKELNTLTVIGCGATKEEAIHRKEYVDSCLLTANKELERNEGYSLEVLGEKSGVKMTLAGKNANGEREEKDLAEIQTLYLNNYNNYKNRVAAYTQTRDYYLNRIFVKPVPKTKDQAVYGFILGVLAAVIILVLYYLFNEKLKTGREMKKRYDLSLLGEFTHSRALWKGKGIDWILEKLEFGKKTDFENELDSIAYLIDEEKDGKTVLLTGTMEEKKLKKLYEGLSARLKEKGIELVMEADYLHNSEAVAASRDLDSVLLAEEKYKSRISDLNRMAEMLTIEDANVIGVVLL